MRRLSSAESTDQLAQGDVSVTSDRTVVITPLASRLDTSLGSVQSFDTGLAMLNQYTLDAVEVVSGVGAIRGLEDYVLTAVRARSTKVDQGLLDELIAVEDKAQLAGSLMHPSSMSSTSEAHKTSLANAVGFEARHSAVDTALNKLVRSTAIQREIDAQERHIRIIRTTDSVKGAGIVVATIAVIVAASQLFGQLAAIPSKDTLISPQPRAAYVASLLVVMAGAAGALMFYLHRQRWARTWRLNAVVWTLIAGSALGALAALIWGLRTAVTWPLVLMICLAVVALSLFVWQVDFSTRGDDES